MWPPEVERIAGPLRAAGIEARLEELAPGEHAFPGTAAQAAGYDCDGRTVVALVPRDSEPDGAKVGAAAQCRRYGRVEPPPFPFAGADRVLVEQRLLTAETVWLEAGSPRHVLGLDPGVLVQLIRASPADITREG